MIDPYTEDFEIHLVNGNLPALQPNQSLPPRQVQVQLLSTQNGMPPKIRQVPPRPEFHPCVRTFGRCNFGEDCLFASFPRDWCLGFLKGKCAENPCSFVHDEGAHDRVRDIRQQKGLPKAGTQKDHPSHGFKADGPFCIRCGASKSSAFGQKPCPNGAKGDKPDMTNSGGRQTTESSEPLEESKLMIACRHFQKGTCQVGDKCRFLHGEKPEPPEASTAPCVFFLKGQCRADPCRYAHPASRKRTAYETFDVEELSRPRAHSMREAFRDSRDTWMCSEIHPPITEKRPTRLPPHAQDQF